MFKYISLATLAISLLLTHHTLGQEVSSHAINTFPEGAQPSLRLPTEEDTAALSWLIRTANALKPISTDSSRTLLAEALEINKQIYFPDGMTTIYIELAGCDIYDGNYESCLANLQKAYQYTRNTVFNTFPVTLRMYNYTAVAYNYLGRDDLSLYYHYKSLQLAVQYMWADAGHISYFPVVFLNIAITLYRSQQYDQALYYLQQAEKLALNSKQFEHLGLIYINMAKYYRAKSDWDMHDVSARNAMRWSDSIVAYNPMEANKQYTTILSSWGDSYIARGNPEKAIGYFLKAKEITRSNNLYENTVLLDKGLGTAYLKAQDYANAEKYLTSAFQAVEKLQLRDRLAAHLHFLLSEFYYKKDNVNQAFAHQQEYIRLNDSLQYAERNKIISQLEVQHRTAVKDNDIAQQQLLLTRQQNEIKDKNLLIIGISGVAMLLGVVVFSAYRHNRHKQQIERLNAIVEGSEQERSRIGRELHDGIMVQFAAVKMNLSTLINRHSHLPGIASFREPITQLDNATRELRRTAHNLMPAALLEEGLIDAIYFFCKNLQQGIPLTIQVQSFGMIPRFTPETELSLYRIVQELVHNIIKHANATQALVELSGQNNLLLISIEDNGRGIPENILTNLQSRIGLTTVKNRISALKGNLDIKSTPGKGTIINIEFDLTHLTGEKKLKYAY